MSTKLEPEEIALKQKYTAIRKLREEAEDINKRPLSEKAKIEAAKKVLAKESEVSSQVKTSGFKRPGISKSGEAPNSVIEHSHAYDSPTPKRQKLDDYSGDSSSDYTSLTQTSESRYYPTNNSISARSDGHPRYDSYIPPGSTLPQQSTIPPYSDSRSRMSVNELVSTSLPTTSPQKESQQYHSQSHYPHSMSSDHFYRSTSPPRSVTSPQTSPVSSPPKKKPIAPPLYRSLDHLQRVPTQGVQGESDPQQPQEGDGNYFPDRQRNITRYDDL